MLELKMDKEVCTFTTMNDSEYWTKNGYKAKPWIHIADPTKDINMMVGRDTLVTSKETIKIHFTYPFTGYYTFEFTNKGGWTKGQLATVITNQYIKMYNEEDKNVGKTGNIKGMLNRATSNGPYGIWGHHIDDLDLSGLYIEEDGSFVPSVES